MPRPDPALLDPARYPFRCDIEPRFRDLDTNLHINNGVMATLLEEGRVRFYRGGGGGGGSVGGILTTMVVSLGIEFIGESHFPDLLEMHVAVTNVGRTSYELVQLITQRSHAVVFARVTLVCMGEAGPFEMTQDYRAALESWMLRP